MLCRSCTARVWAIVRALAPDDLSERQRFSNRVWSDETVVMALLAGETAEALRLMAERAKRRERRVLAGI